MLDLVIASIKAAESLPIEKCKVDYRMYQEKAVFKADIKVICDSETVFRIKLDYNGDEWLVELLDKIGKVIDVVADELGLKKCGDRLVFRLSGTVTLYETLSFAGMALFGIQTALFGMDKFASSLIEIVESISDS